jgi:hypothetical protein
VILRYKVDQTHLPARLGQAPDAEGAQLLVRYGADIAVAPPEAQRDCELVSATREELEALQAAGYALPLAADFRQARA